MPDTSGLKKILIIRLSSIGDILLTTPLIRSLRKQNHGARIDFVLKGEFFELLKNNPHLSNIYRYSKKSTDRKELFKVLKLNEYDLVIDLQNNSRSGEITSKLKSKVVWFKKHNIKKFLLVNFKINLLKKYPQIPLRYAHAAGIELDDYGLEIFFEETADERLKLNEKIVGLCPGAKHFTKRWPEKYFIELGKKLEADNYKVVLFGGPDENKLCNNIESQLTNSLNLSNESILQTAANMKMCKLIYTNDSGTMHLASAVQVPVIAVFGSTVKEFGFFPYKAKSIELEVENLHCRPCTHIGRNNCPLIHFKCMKEINPELAYSSLIKLVVS